MDTTTMEDTANTAQLKMISMRAGDLAQNNGIAIVGREATGDLHLPMAMTVPRR